MKINYGLIRAKMAERKTTGQGLAVFLGIHPNSAWAKLRGDVPFTVEELAKFSAEYGVSINDLIIIEKSPATRI